MCIFGIPGGQPESSIHLLERARAGNRHDGLDATKQQIKFKNMFAPDFRMQQL